MSRSTFNLLLFVLLAAVSLLVYARSLGNGFVLWDDDKLIERNPLVTEFSARSVVGAFTSYDPELYVPLTIVSFQIEHALVGFNPMLFHVTNLLLHIVCAFLVFLVLSEAGAKRDSPLPLIDSWVAAFCALLFALHPLNVEAVAWASARKDVLSTAFALGSLLGWLRFRASGQRRWHRWSFVLLLLSLLSKPTAIVLPFVFVLVDWLGAGANGDSRPAAIRELPLRDWGSRFRALLPFFGLSILFLVIGLLGKARNISSLTFLQTALLSVKSAIVSLSLFVWPRFSLLFLESRPIALADLSFLIPVAILLLLIVLIAWSLRWTCVVAFAFGFVFLTLLPSFSNFAKAGNVYLTSDRYLYLPQVGLLFLLGLGLTRLLRRDSRVLRMVIGAVAIVVLLTSGWSSMQRSLLWKDSETLFDAAFAANPKSDVLLYNLGYVYQERGEGERARQAYRNALALHPRSGKAHFNLGILEQKEGNIDAALAAYRQAAALDPADAEACNNVGAILQDRGDIDGAIVQFREAITRDPRYARAHVNLAAAYGKKGMYEEGLKEYREAARWDAGLREKLKEMGVL